MSATVTTDKCVNVVPGGERYCSSVYFPISGPISDAGIIARVVVPYEEMESVYDRVVDVAGLNVSIVRSGSSSAQYNTGFADVSIGLFDTEGNARTFLGRYKLVLDQGTVRIPDCGGFPCWQFRVGGAFFPSG